ncbi:MAG: sulfatase, partial [Planctomycetota bacterium]
MGRFLPLFGLLLVTACGAGDSTPESTNLLVVVMDTTRGDRCSLNGYERSTTPNLDRIAAGGTVYTDAWAPTSWTGPAHASMFTGLRPENHGFRSGVRLYLDPSARTLAEILSDGGYATACLTNNPQISEEMGLIQGFEVYEEGGVRENSARWTTDRALEIAKRHRADGRPFFVFVNDWEPHLPYDPPERIAGDFLPEGVDPAEVARLRKFKADVPVLFGETWRAFGRRQWEILSGLYDAEIAALDVELGRLVAGLDRAGILDDTLLVIVGDHGENLGDHGLCSHVFSLHRSLRHVPLLVRFPDRFEPGRRVGETVRLEDLFPTILEVLDLPRPSGLDGTSLLTDGGPRLSRAVLGSL